MLTVKHLDVSYGDVQVLRRISLEVREGEIVALVGANSAGKTTTLKTVSGLLKPNSGEIQFEGQRIDRRAPHKIVEIGLVHVPEGRKIFGNLTVFENLEMGAFVPRAQAQWRERLRLVFDLFPRLEERHNQKAGTLSGGEQQMLAIGRALMVDPRLLMLDEPSLGLAPLVVEQIFKAIEQVNRDRGTPILIVEQNVTHALRMATRAYVIENGEIVLEGTGAELLANPDMKRAYLGL
ncbi:MAG: ABC transporter ATP-binding protein [Chloroflexota bacterium]